MAASSAHDVSTPSGPSAVIERAYAALRRGATDEWIAMWTDDIEIRQTEAVPWGGVHRGHAACVEFLRVAGEHIASDAGPEEPLVVSGDEVVAIGRSRGVARKTGRSFDIRVVHVWKVRDDRIAGWTLHVDTDALRPALGLTDAATEA